MEGFGSLHCKDTITENLTQILPEKELCGLCPNFHNLVSVSDLFPQFVFLFCCRKYVDRP
jgi:hypothetical protein